MLDHTSNRSPCAAGWLPQYIVTLTAATLLPTLLNMQWPQQWHGRVFVLLLAVSHLALASALSCLPGWACLRWQPLRWIGVPLVVVLSCAWVLLVLVDARVYQLFGFHLNGLVLALLWQGGLLQQLGLPPLTWAGLGLASAALLMSHWGLVRGLQSQWARRWALRPRWLLILLPMVAMSQGMAIWYDAQQRGGILAAVQAVPWAQTATARRAMVQWGLAGAAADELSHAGPHTESALNYPRSTLQCQADKPSNVVLLVVDSLRADMVSPQQMPNLARFSEQAWRAGQHYSTGNNTMHGMFGLFYGLPALHTNAMIHHRRGPVLLDQLARRNYQFYLYGGASLQGARLDRAVFVQTDAPLHTAPDSVAQDRRDRNVIDRLRADLRAHDPARPFFAFALLDSAHTPYAVPGNAEQRFRPQARTGDHLKVGRRTDPLPLFNRYRNAVLKADTLLGEVLLTLEHSDLVQNTVVVITSDHGESFNDLGQNDWGHNSNFSDFQTRVPLLIRWPGRAPMTESSVTSHIDLAPTLLRHLLGCSTSISAYASGMDLFAALPAQRPLLVESWTSRAVRLGAATMLLRPYGIEVRDDQYRPSAQAPLAPEVHAAIISQMQQLR